MVRRLASPAVLLVASLHLAAISGCHDARTAAALSPGADPGATTVGLVIAAPAVDDDTALVSLQLTPGRDGGALGSLTVAVQFDPAALAFAGDASAGDGVMRALHAADNTVRIAVAAPGGLDTGHVAQFRFMVRRAAGLRTLGLRVDEVHRLDGTDATRSTRAVPASGAGVR